MRLQELLRGAIKRMIVESHVKQNNDLFEAATFTYQRILSRTAPSVCGPWAFLLRFAWLLLRAAGGRLLATWFPSPPRLSDWSEICTDKKSYAATALRSSTPASAASATNAAPSASPAGSSQAAARHASLACRSISRIVATLLPEREPGVGAGNL